MSSEIEIFAVVTYKFLLIESLIQMGLNLLFFGGVFFCWFDFGFSCFKSLGVVKLWVADKKYFYGLYFNLFLIFCPMKGMILTE